MKVTYLGTTSSTGQCPTAYATDRGTYLIQGEIVTDPEALAELREHGNGIPDHETVVEVPAALMTYVREHQETTS
ncbi:hypothetical protein [Saccharomonospora iraqiensis]|uniref:hypothetical protein n=1 Tax=Saccharomonospora iraqiensis TaxID=52698 RepID=UPI0004294AB1|nr:hypothetical protein [Saccharomonospora iraqiensis]